ncbi:hypothetical protein FACS1894170_11200 [Planctomycetales bacterium]|nr:hypothetical protein FACS1894170_11200 [Planctomycetales bacterium]
MENEEMKLFRLLTFCLLFFTCLVLPTERCAGFLPVVGTAADLINGGIHAARGNYVEAGFSVIAMVPVVGDGISGARKVAKAADKVGDAVQGAGNLAKTTNKISEGVTATKGTSASGACFTAGTQIVVGVIYNEEDCSTVYVTESIENIEVGDLVYSYDTLTGEVSQREVTTTFVRESDHLNYLTIVDENGNEQVIETTDSHPFWVITNDPDLSRAAQEIVNENGTTLYHENLGVTENGYWVAAKDLREGDVFLGANGELSVLVAQERVTFADGIKVYNFTVDGNHDYFIIGQVDEYGQTCILVHNSNCTNGSRIVKHHTIPREIQALLRDANNPTALDRSIIGKKGLPNKIKISEDLHKKIHKGVGGGDYNEAFKKAIQKSGGYGVVTVEQVLAIRDRLVRRFGL